MAKAAKTKDTRVERSQAKVLAETYRQLAKNGVGGVSIDEIARNCGIAKTTIYRHWPSRSALLIDACSRLGSATEVPDTGNLRSDLKALSADLANQLQAANWSSVYPSIIDAAERDPEIAAMQAALHNAFVAPFEAVIERAKAKGEISSSRATIDVVAVLVGSLFYCRWFARRGIDRRFIAAITDIAAG